MENFWKWSLILGQKFKNLTNFAWNFWQLLRALSFLSFVWMYHFSLVSSTYASILSRSLSMVGSILQDEIFTIYTRKRQKMKKIGKNGLKLVDKQPEITRNQKSKALWRSSTPYVIFEGSSKNFIRKLLTIFTFFGGWSISFSDFFP